MSSCKYTLSFPGNKTPAKCWTRINTMSKLLIRDKIIKTYAFKYIYILISIVTLKVTGCNHPSLSLLCEIWNCNKDRCSIFFLWITCPSRGTRNIQWTNLRRQSLERKLCSVLFNLLPSAARYAGTWLCWWFAGMWSVADPADPKAYAWVPAFPWRTEFTNMNWCSRSGCLPEKCPRWREIVM